MRMPGQHVRALVSVALLLAFVPTWARAGEAPGPTTQAGASGRVVPEPKLPVADVMTLALKLALDAQALTIAEGSLQGGQVTTGYRPLQTEMIPMATRVGRGGFPDRAGVGAEYRYHARLGGANRTLLRLRAEIRAWSTEPAAGGNAPLPSTIASSGHLERQFLQSFREAVVSV